MVCQIGEKISSVIDKIPNLIKSKLLAGCSITLGYQAYLIARDCTITISAMSLGMMNQKSSESAKTGLDRSFQVLLPQLYLFGSLSLGSMIMAKFAYDYAKKSFAKNPVQQPKVIVEPAFIPDPKLD